MEYFEINCWSVGTTNLIKYSSRELNEFGIAFFSVRKTYSEGIDIMISIHARNSSFFLVSSSESRCSGPSECIVGEYFSLESAKQALMQLCSENDEYYL